MKLKFSASSPVSISTANLIITIIVFFFPSSLYFQVLKERCLFCFDFLMLAFVTSCLCTQALSAKLIELGLNKLAPKRKINEIQLTQSKLSLIQSVVVFFQIGFILIFLKNNSDAVILLIMGYGTDYKMTIEQSFSGITYTILGLSFFVHFFYFELKSEKKHCKTNTALNHLVFIGNLTISIIMLARYLLMPYLLGLISIFLFRKNIKNSIYIISTSTIGLILVFILFSLARVFNTEDTVSTLSASILGYTVASFNRLSAILSDRMSYFYGKDFFYIMPALAKIPLLPEGFSNYFNFSLEDVWSREFYDVSESGLNQYYIWGTVYGYIYSTLRGWSIFYFAFNGILMGFLWFLFKKRNIFGVVLYPWFFATCVLYPTFNLMYYPQIYGLILAAIILFLYLETRKLIKK